MDRSLWLADRTGRAALEATAETIRARGTCFWTWLRSATAASRRAPIPGAPLCSPTQLVARLGSHLAIERHKICAAAR